MKHELEKEVDELKKSLVSGLLNWKKIAIQNRFL